MIQEYTYKAGIAPTDILDKTLLSILKTTRPKAFAVLNALRWPWLWKLAGIRLKVHYQEVCA